MLAAPSTSYDEMPYESVPHRETHPDRLATVATLLGLHPPPVSRCRVLELGCAVGGNLLPMALTLPDSQFVGIELSGRQVAEAQRVAAALGVHNVEFQQRSILDVPDDFGPFDYILSHGVYSWVPEAAQDKVLEVSSRCLSPGGIAYISFNAYPGWHIRGMIREMMCYHLRQTTRPDERTRQARHLLDFLVRWAQPANGVYARLLQGEQELLRRTDDCYLLHEHLEEFNNPVYFTEFVRRAGAKGLRYLGEADFWLMLPGNFPPDVEEVLRALGTDNVKLEQYMDFLRYRLFRETLLCHQEQSPSFSLRPKELTAFHYASPAEPKGFDPRGVDLSTHAPLQFVGRKGATLSCHEPLVKAVFLHLWEVWPAAVSFDALLKRAQERLQSPKDDFTTSQYADFLSRYLLKLYSSAGTTLLDLHVHPPRVTRQVSDRPLASPLARLQATRGSRVTNLRHESVELDEAERRLLGRLDGTQDWTGLGEVLGPQAPASLEEYLHRLARKALLQA